MQPAGYVHSLGFLDQARYFRHMFRRLGARVTMAKNRLREDAVNFVFGAHLGFPFEWQQRNPCVFVNLEQLGQGGATVSADYLTLLRRSAVVDYDAANVAAYAQDPADVPIVPFGYASYLDKPAMALEDRPIDLLFFGSMNPRRQQFIARVEAAGYAVAAFDHPIYGPERDDFIRTRPCVELPLLREQPLRAGARCSTVRRCTPVISERTPHTAPAPAFEDSVLWLPEQIESWFTQHFAKPAFYDEARRTLAAFRGDDGVHDPLEAYADHRVRERLPAGFARTLRRGSSARPGSTWAPARTTSRTGSSTTSSTAPSPTSCSTSTACRAAARGADDAGRHRAPGGRQPDLIYANNVLEHVPDLPMLMGNALKLLREGGEFSIEVPYEKS